MNSLQTCQHITKENITENLQGVLIYKDECTRCFETTVTKYSLNKQ
jgi:uncharacterized UBP type Zn finger protein